MSPAARVWPVKRFAESLTPGHGHRSRRRVSPSWPTCPRLSAAGSFRHHTTHHHSSTRTHTCTCAGSAAPGASVMEWNPVTTARHLASSLAVRNRPPVVAPTGQPKVAVAVGIEPELPGRGSIHQHGDDRAPARITRLNAPNSLNNRLRASASSAQFVAHPVDREDGVRVLRVRLDLGPDVPDMHVYRPIEAFQGAIRDMLEQLRPAKVRPGERTENGQQSNSIGVGLRQAGQPPSPGGRRDQG